MLIVPPSSLKMFTCNKVYGLNYALPKSKNVSRNKEGLSGGNFKKHEMFKALIDGDIQCPILNFCIDNQEEILSMKNIPKPIDDLIDAIFLSLYVNK
jgi:hypothetical protein